MRIFSSDENLRRVLRGISLTRLVVFDTLILRFLCFRLKIADVSLSQWGYLVSHRLTPHTRDDPDTWEFEATADKRACLQFREGPRKNHFIAGLYSLPFLITAQAIE